MKKAIVLVGIPGSGKSTYGKTLKLPYFSSDMIRLELFKTLKAHHDPEDDQRVFTRLHELVFSFGDSLIYDATNIDRKKRIFLYKEFKQRGYTVEVHLILEPKALALFQNKRRDPERVVPDFVVKDMYRGMMPPKIGVDTDDFKIISQSNFLSEPITLDTFVDYLKSNGSYKTIRRFINAAYLPEILKLEDDMDVFTHTDKMIINAKSLELVLASFFHDLGKGTTKLNKFKLHEQVSSMYAFRFFNEIKNIPPSLRIRDIIDVVLHHTNYPNIKPEILESQKLDSNVLTLLEQFNLLNQESH